MTRTISAVRAITVGLAVAVAASMSLGGCGSDEPAVSPGAIFTDDQVSRFVIARGDFPSDYKEADPTGAVPCDSGWMVNQGAIEETASEAALRRQLLALGPQACHLSVYEKTRRDGPNGDLLSVTGFNVIAVVFPDEGAASRSLPLFHESLSDAYLTESYADADGPIGFAQDVATAGLGDESIPGIKRGPTREMDFAPTTIDFVWRVRNVAMRLSGGFGDDVSQGDVLEAAKKISTRAVG